MDPWWRLQQSQCTEVRLKDGGTLEYVFEAGEQNFPNAVTKEKAA